MVFANDFIVLLSCDCEWTRRDASVYSVPNWATSGGHRFTLGLKLGGASWKSQQAALLKKREDIRLTLLRAADYSVHNCKSSKGSDSLRMQ